jgi:hypothetical protein
MTQWARKSHTIVRRQAVPYTACRPGPRRLRGNAAHYPFDLDPRVG